MHGRGSRALQQGTHATKARLTLAPILDEGGEGVGRTEVQARFDILAVALEERLQKLMHTQAETAAQAARAKAAERLQRTKQRSRRPCRRCKWQYVRIVVFTSFIILRTGYALPDKDGRTLPTTAPRA